MNNILSAKGIAKAFDDKVIFRDLDVDLSEGQTVALLGPSGIGKTTLMNILSGVMTPDEGRVTLCGEDITGKPGHISYMQQKDLLLPYYTVLYNVALPLIIKGESKKEALKKAGGYFEFFGLAGYEDKYPKELSGGMRQRAALLRTYIQSGKVVLLDEPFGALDAVTRRKMQKWYLGISKELELSTVVITHDTDEALILADRVYIMGEGKELDVIDLKDKPSNFELTEEFIKLKKQIVSYL
ncbi:MAG: ATP-binding cassette domain-containing protein [Clostridia bacterium]|nr:ATP-binding cassette domain-containing protein [Clostridia bacterium]